MKPVQLGKMKSICMCVFISVLLRSSNGHPEYQAMIPNAANVLNVCTADNATDVWPKVGHASLADTDTEKTVFGMDFLQLYHNQQIKSDIWPLLCVMDSDGDGRTNGAELGDPGCAWAMNTTNPSQTYITNPGIPDAANGTMTDADRVTYCY